jgi:hypothetical protein
LPPSPPPWTLLDLVSSIGTAPAAEAEGAAGDEFDRNEMVDNDRVTTAAHDKRQAPEQHATSQRLSRINAVNFTPNMADKLNELDKTSQMIVHHSSYESCKWITDR